MVYAGEKWRRHCLYPDCLHVLSDCVAPVDRRNRPASANAYDIQTVIRPMDKNERPLCPRPVPQAWKDRIRNGWTSFIRSLRRTHRWNPARHSIEGFNFAGGRACRVADI